jgi:uncharacterized cofD-like protein
MGLSDYPPPTRPPYGGPRIVTLGGGHGQATLLAALAGLECDLSAIVSIADDGGCSGRLREELRMPPPGDLRRCLASLATESDVALRFEERLLGGDEAGRCVGNLVLAELTQELGSLQLAVDWAAALLGCVGRVVPAADSAGVLTVWDREHGPLAGESLIERSSAAPLVVVVEGPEAASEYAREAIEKADVLLLGPGSFVGSTLAVLATGDVAACVARARARRILMKNVAKEPAPQGIAGFELVDHERMLSDHLLIASEGEPIEFDVLEHDASGLASVPRAEGGRSLGAPMADATGRHHDVLLLREALAQHLELAPRRALTKERRHFEPRALLEQRLESARRRLFGAVAT